MAVKSGWGNIVGGGGGANNREKTVHDLNLLIYLDDCIIMQVF